MVTVSRIEHQVICLRAVTTFHSPPSSTVNDEMTTSEQSEREDAEDTESTVHVDRLAVSVTDGAADAKTAKVTMARSLCVEIISMRG